MKQKSPPGRLNVILNSASGHPITWGPFTSSFGGLASSKLAWRMGSGFSLPSANSEIGPASRVVWGHQGGSMLGTLQGRYGWGPVCARTSFPGRVEKRGLPGHEGDGAVTGDD